MEQSEEENLHKSLDIMKRFEYLDEKDHICKTEMQCAIWFDNGCEINTERGASYCTLPD